MRQNVNQLAQFYDSSMGMAAHAMVMRRLTSLWPLKGNGAQGPDILGLGYCTPYLSEYLPYAHKMILAMPGGQGAMIACSRRGNMSCLVEEDGLPFPPVSFDRVLLAHAIEETDSLPQLLSEVWRVMKPEGRLVIIAPNRAGLWARSDASPFGAGRPFSRSQLSTALKSTQFQPCAWAGALYAPPISGLMKEGLVSGFERFGETVCPRFSGLVLVEAIKRLYADNSGGATSSLRRPNFSGITPAQTSLKGSQ